MSTLHTSNTLHKNTSHIAPIKRPAHMSKHHTHSAIITADIAMSSNLSDDTKKIK